MDFTRPSNLPTSQTLPKPTLPSPFFMFLADQQKIITDQSPNTKLVDIAANVINEWDQIMSIQDEYTAKFLEESEKIEAAMISNLQASLSNQPEIQNFLDPHGNPTPPKRAFSPYIFFLQDFRDQAKRENPDLTFAALTQLLGERWKALDQQTKSYYEAKSQEARVLYQQQVALFEAKYGKVETYRKAKKAGRTRLGGAFQMSSHQNPI